MYIVDDIVYAGEQKKPVSLISVRPMDGYKLRARFSTGEVKAFDFAPLLDAPCFQPLKDKAVFDGVYIDYGVPVWSDGNIDIAPERLYQDGVPIDEI